MGKSQRDKGLRGELEVRHEFERAGFPVRGLDGQGDNLVVCAEDLLLHLETKRQETLRLPLWARQAAAEAPEAAIPIVLWRRSREDWRADLSLQDLLALLVRATKQV
jgi:hypothetical protein